VRRDETQRQVDALRARASELENHLIDEYRSGSINRREFVRRAGIVGMSATSIAFLASACGVSREELEKTDAKQTEKPKPGGTIRIGTIEPASGLDPDAANNQGALTVLGQTGEYLVWADSRLNARPRLAESWKPAEDGQVWRFKIRSGVKFHDGRPLEAEDVAATFNRLADEDVGGNALSVLSGTLTKGNAKALDTTTVEFQLDAPNGNFPFLVSSENYNSIILPRDYEEGWDKNFMGSGPWKLDSYRPDEGVSYVPNPDYWDPQRRANADRFEMRFYATEQALTLGLLGNEVDAVLQFSVAGGKSLLTDDTIRTSELHAASHRQVHIRTDKEPFTDKRVRQAMAFLVNRRNLVDGLLDTKSDYGNDSPFAPAHKSTDRSVPQRQQDIAKARELLAAAGQEGGFGFQIDTWDGFEMPDLAALIQNDVRAAGLRGRLNITDSASYYGDAVFGKSRWLDSTMGITEYGHRGVPNTLLRAPLISKGTWNSAHFKNDQYDQLVDDYVAALDLQTQRRYARQIQELLLDEVPIMFTYFYYYLSAEKTYMAGIENTAMGHIDVSRAGFTET
jgi:peptide/nickel transport system substrate-binding protein